MVGNVVQACHVMILSDRFVEKKQLRLNIWHYINDEINKDHPMPQFHPIL